MNRALKHWKEAATVILAAGVKAPCRSADKVSVTAPLQTAEGFDYRVLLLKRSGKSGFMPNACVFPGGLAEDSDFSSEWLDLFKPFGKLPNFGLGAVKQRAESRPPMFATDRAELGSLLSGDVAFRICAVRETFEEAGVLLVVPREEAERLVVESSFAQFSPTAVREHWSESVVSQWRSLVMENSSNFIRMCRELDCLPNIWALHEWGNWLTPTGLYDKQRRYDTAFYMCCLQEIPNTLQDQKEIIHFEWSSPSEILHRYQEKQIWIAPPQFYDLGRMCNFSLLNDLHKFAKSRSLEGCEQWLPVHLAATDCRISLLPGDSLYPENPDFTGTASSTAPAEKCLENLQKESPNLHRIVFHNLYTTSVYMNVKPKYKHIPPLTRTDFNNSSTHDSKL